MIRKLLGRAKGEGAGAMIKTLIAMALVAVSGCSFGVARPPASSAPRYEIDAAVRATAHADCLARRSELALLAQEQDDEHERIRLLINLPRCERS